MTTEQNKAVAHAFFERFSAGDIAGALDTQHANDVWSAPLTADEEKARSS
jgi:ketosteroid isomerase-like protein